MSLSCVIVHVGVVMKLQPAEGGWCLENLSKNNLEHRLTKCQSPRTILWKTALTWMYMWILTLCHSYFFPLQFIDLCILLGCDYCDSIKGTVLIYIMEINTV